MSRPPPARITQATSRVRSARRASSSVAVARSDGGRKAVAEALRLDLAKPADKRKESGALKRVEEKDDMGMSRPFVIIGDWAND